MTKDNKKSEQLATEADVLVPKDKKDEKKDENKGEEISFFKLFQFATKSDMFYMLSGSIGAIVNGAAMPLFTLVFGDIATDFGPPNTGDQTVDAAGDLSLKLTIIGVVTYVAAYISYSGWTIAGERQSIQFRKEYFKSLLTQDITFYDSINPNELSTHIAEECLHIQQGIGDKVSTAINCVSMFITGFVIGYIKGWQLALVMTGTIPLVAFSGALFAFSMQKFDNVVNLAYGRAGAISEEALNSIRTVVSLGGQDKEVKRYRKAANEGFKMLKKYAALCGVGMGSLYFALFLTYALGFFIGSIFIENDVYNPVSDKPYDGSSVLIIFFSIMMSGFTAGRIAPCLKAFAVAKSAASKAFKIINRKSKINIEDQRGLKPTQVEGNIKFRDVEFAYPLKPERVILNKISFDIRKNEKTAFVGESGCGKTTSMQLIERFYDLETGNGSITLDGNELRDLNLKWMRDNIGYVGQEPVLFATSVRENMKMAKEDATDEQIWEALKRANAYDFVHGLPDKLDSFVGNAGTMLSGGQKQRLAIARAILKNPKILLLDEATSALDRRNEMEIQKTLDEISEGRTTIVIAHRLSTIINADHIIVFDQGKIVEEGRHADLVAKRGRYYALQHLQLQTEEKEKQKEAQEDKSEGDISGSEITEKPALIRAPSMSRKASAQTAKVEDVSMQISQIKAGTDNGKKPFLQASNKKQGNPMIRLLSWCKGDYTKITIGVITSLINGCINPCVALLIARMLALFAMPDNPDYRSKANLYSIMLLVIAFVSFACYYVILDLFITVAEDLSKRIRGNVFEKYLKLPIGWFDDPKNAPGALSSELSTDANKINMMIASVLSMYIQAISCYICGMAIALASCWQLGLIGIACSPIAITANVLRGKFDSAMTTSNDENFKESSAFVAEAVINMRTVASFGTEHVIYGSYSKILDVPLKKAVKRYRVSGFAFGMAEAVNFGVYALIFYLGAIFIRDIDLDFLDMLQAIFSIMFSYFGVGGALQFAQDTSSAKNSARKIFNLIDAVPSINIDDPNQTVTTPIKGDIEFKNVWFKYPSREKQIFSGLNLKIKASTKVAFVGPSGCGKSTILALLQRFYDVDQGEIFIDGVEIRKYDLKHLRESFGVVSQEPVLFNGTIEYNIKYSKENATDEEMRSAAEKANALKFIENNEFDVAGPGNDNPAKFGTGFQRKVGLKGSQMSGGQKQRLAIARAILKNPSVLILDEATSALDAENEKMVQESLDKIMEGKTSLIVAHRISTIKDADDIIVFSDGQIIERGSYQTLRNMKGAFYKLEQGINT